MSFFRQRFGNITIVVNVYGGGAIDLINGNLRFTEPGFQKSNSPTGNIFILPPGLPPPTLDTLLTGNYPTIPTEIPVNDILAPVITMSDMITRVTITIDMVSDSPEIEFKQLNRDKSQDVYTYKLLVVTNNNRRRYYVQTE
jgi:hypothetical protein